MPVTRIGWRPGPRAVPHRRVRAPAGNSAMLRNSSGTTARVLPASAPGGIIRTTGVTRRPSGSTSASAARTAPRSLPRTRRPGPRRPLLGGRGPVALADRQRVGGEDRERRRQVTIATTRRVAGFRAASRMLTPARTRPRASIRRPSGAAVGVVRWASTRPTTTASRPGATRATGPSRPPVAKTTTMPPAPAMTTASVAPSAQPAAAWRHPAQQPVDRLPRHPGDGQDRDDGQHHAASATAARNGQPSSTGGVTGQHPVRATYTASTASAHPAPRRAA